MFKFLLELMDKIFSTPEAKKQGEEVVLPSEKEGIILDKFGKVMKFVFHWEGGLIDHPNDPGGLTNFGIAQRSHPDVDIRNLTEEQAKEIYRKEYWNKINGDDLPEPIALAVMDYAVNSGVTRASRTLQRVVGSQSDGIIGPATLENVRQAIEARGAIKVAQEIVLTRSDFLSALVRKKPTMTVFLKGWMRRTHSCMAAVTE